MAYYYWRRNEMAAAWRAARRRGGGVISWRHRPAYQCINNGANNGGVAQAASAAWRGWRRRHQRQRNGEMAYVAYGGMASVMALLMAAAATGVMAAHHGVMAAYGGWRLKVWQWQRRGISGALWRHPAHQRNGESYGVSVSVSVAAALSQYGGDKLSALTNNVAKIIMAAKIMAA